MLTVSKGGSNIINIKHYFLQEALKFNLLAYIKKKSTISSCFTY